MTQTSNDTVIASTHVSTVLYIPCHLVILYLKSKSLDSQTIHRTL